MVGNPSITRLGKGYPLLGSDRNFLQDDFPLLICVIRALPASQCFENAADGLDAALASLSLRSIRSIRPFEIV